MTSSHLTLGTRGSELALAQTTTVTALLKSAHPDLDVRREIIQTSGDKRQDLRFSEFQSQAHVDKGIFIKELETALETEHVDAAVHSLKDVPSDLAPGFVIAAVLERAPIEDVLITKRPHTLETLPKGARVGTSSVRRARQLQFLRPDLEIVEVRGNVPTRVRKVLGEEPLDAILLAAAGLVRLDLLDIATSQITIDGQTIAAHIFDPTLFLPAAGQGAIAIECRANDLATQTVLAAIDHEETHTRVTAEREFLRLLGAGCQTPVGARTWFQGGQLHMAVRVFSEKDLTAAPLELKASAEPHEPDLLAKYLATQVMEHPSHR